MKDRPIIMSAPMVRAILSGQKTQTRRIVKPVGNDFGFNLVERADGSYWPWRSHDGESEGYLERKKDSYCYNEAPLLCPYGEPRDRLWVRETWRYTASTLEESRAITEDITSGIAVDWRATFIDECIKYGFTREDAEMADDFEEWRPSIHMPRWASRILLDVVSVRVERLKDISKADAMLEGIVEVIDGYGLQDGSFYDGADPIESYAALWESINGQGSWDANPWVWVVEFKRVTA